MSPEFRKLFFTLDPQVRPVSKGEFLFREGEKPKWLILAENNLVLEFQHGENPGPCPDGIEKLWGMREILTDTEFASTAVAGTEMECFIVPSDYFLEKTRQDVMFRLLVMEQIAREINRRKNSFEEKKATFVAFFILSF